MQWTAVVDPSPVDLGCGAIGGGTTQWFGTTPHETPIKVTTTALVAHVPFRGSVGMPVGSIQ